MRQPAVLRVVGFSFCLFIYCFNILPALASSEQPQGSEDKAVTSQSKETVQDLLIFWEEKDLFVETPTRNSKRISDVAENITVITAKEIEDMNAHTVSEILSRVPGLFVDFQGHDFGSTALYSIQGSTERHVLVLLDGTPRNFLNSGSAETISIPVKTIERIEVIKGPASSAWGSSLGGVINIITKHAGSADKPSGALSASYGEGASQDYNAEISGKVGEVGYYLYGGRQESDGMTGRAYERNSLFSKFRLILPGEGILGLSLGYSEPVLDFGDLPSGDLSSKGLIRAFHTNASFDTRLSKTLSFNLAAYYLKQKFVQDNDVLGLGYLGSEGDQFLEADFDEQTLGAGARLLWASGMHNAVLGVEASHGELDQRLEAGSLLQLYGVSALSTFSPSVDKYAVYANDTLTIDKFTVTPGIRFDHSSVTGSFVSPSLGLTYKFSRKVIARASLARGFSSPPLSMTSGGALFLDPNPFLDAEEVWSYQAGIESNVTDYIWLKATVFRHDLEDAIVKDPFGAGAPTFNDLFINEGDVKRKGIELAAETMPFYNLSLKAGFSYVTVRSTSADVDDADMYMYTAVLKYDDRDSIMAQVYGNYTWWNASQDGLSARYDDLIVDINATKKIYTTDRIRLDLFLTGHNIFNGAQYTFIDMMNPDRWVEAGLRFKF